MILLLVCLALYFTELLGELFLLLFLKLLHLTQALFTLFSLLFCLVFVSLFWDYFYA